MNIKNKHILFLILLVAAVLRFWNYFEIPYSHDEFSALFRTGFTSFSELIEKGVKTDTHPAGVQIFMNYWELAFGSTPWIMKLPFTLMGLASIFLVYKIGKIWFTETNGLVSAALLAVIQYHIMYSQTARPYISGLFLCMLMVWFWSKLVKSPETSFWKNGLLFSVFAAACAYNHHFSLLMAAIVGLSGVYFIPFKHMFRYAFLGLLIFVLYLPHLPIFLLQLKQGGVGGEEGWLAAPTPLFFSQYIRYIFHYSAIFLIAFLGIGISGFFFRNARLKWRPTLLFLTWFLIPLLTGYFYSVYKNPVLQYSVILFSFPFLILAFLAHYKELKAWQNAILVLIIMTLGSVTLTSNRQHFKLFYESPYKEILKEQEIAFRINPKTLRLINNYPKVNKYYGSFMPIDTNYVAAQKFNTEKEFLEFLELNSEDYDQLFYGTKYSANPLFIPAILSYYPVIKETKNYAGGSAYLFSKGTPNFPKLFSSKKLQSADSTEFIPLFSFSPAEKGLSQIDHLDVSVEFRPRTSYKEIFIVSAVMHKDSTLLWRSTNIEKFDLVSKWIKAHHTLDLSFIKRPLNEVSIKVYIWNPEKKPFDFRHVNSHFRKGNPYIHALYNEITE